MRRQDLTFFVYSIEPHNETEIFNDPMKCTIEVRCIEQSMVCIMHFKHEEKKVNFVSTLINFKAQKELKSYRSYVVHYMINI